MRRGPSDRIYCILSHGSSVTNLPPQNPEIIMAVTKRSSLSDQTMLSLRKRGGGTSAAAAVAVASKGSLLHAPKAHSSSIETRKRARSQTIRFCTLLLLVLAGYLAITSKTLEPAASSHIQTKQRARFPKYGTEEFTRQCNWTLPTLQDTTDRPCAYLVRPPVRSNEGIADWASQITKAYIEAKQVGCKVFFDYGLDVDISQVLTPFPGHDFHNWTVPDWVECNAMCQMSVMHRVGNWKMNPKDKGLNYRHVYTFSFDFLYRGQYDYLKDTLPGFQIESGMACALGNLFHLAPTADQFESNLFTKLLPALQDEKALVIALYIRTNRADVMATNEKRNETIQAEIAGRYQSVADSYAQVAFCLEEEYLSGQTERGVDIIRVVWMVLSDSPEAKKSVMDGYNGQDANARLAKEKRQWKSRVIPREVLATGARGIHVRAERNPSTSEFAEAFIDWYLIGESDVVIADMQSSFGPTGALRTSRPVYRGNCTKLTLIHEPPEKKTAKS